MIRRSARALTEAKIAPFASVVGGEPRLPQEALDTLVRNLINPAEGTR